MQGLLKTSTARFKVVIGHHPCFSYGSHCKFNEDAMIQECCEQRLTASLCALFDVQTAGDCATMSSLLQPIFEENKVDIYFAGHDHNLQFINKSQVRVLQQNKQAEQCATASEIGITLSLRHLTGGNPRCTISIPRGIWSRIRRAHWCS
eukprot:scaffold19935_cov19-Tisochrysis_lutea.AAC.1